MQCTWKKIDGRYSCQAVKCPHWLEGGRCSIGKVTLSCDNNDCKWNEQIEGRFFICSCMDVHLDADGKCLGLKPR
jgi:hypothetical protein